MKKEPSEAKAGPAKGGHKSDPLTPEELRELPEKVRITDLERIESKIDEILYMLGKGRPRTTAEIRRQVDSDFIRLQSRREQRAREKELQEKKK